MLYRRMKHEWNSISVFSHDYIVSKQKLNFKFEQKAALHSMQGGVCGHWPHYQHSRLSVVPRTALTTALIQPLYTHTPL